LGTGLLLSMLLLQGGCWREETSKRLNLRVGMDLWPGYYPLVIAQECGFTSEEGLDLKLSTSSDTRSMIADYTAGRYEAVCLSLGDVLLLTHSRPGTRVLLFTDESAGGDQLLSFKALPGLEGLRGMKIGTNLDGFGEVFIRRFLATHGLGPDDVVLINTDASLVPSMLERGTIDMGHTWEPYAEQVRARGGQVWFTSKDTPGLVLDCLVVDDALLRNRRREMQGLVRAWCRAVDWWQLHREEGNSIVERRLKLPANSVRAHGIKLLGRGDNQRLQGTGTGNMESAVDEHMDYFVRKGMSVRRVPAAELVDREILQ